MEKPTKPKKLTFSKLWSLCRSLLLVPKSCFLNKSFFFQEKPIKTNNNIVKPMEKPTKPKKNNFLKTMEPLPPPSSFRKLGFWPKVYISKEEPTKTNKHAVEPNGKTNKT